MILVNKLKNKIICGFDAWAKTYTKDVVPKLKRRGHGYDQLASNIISFLKPDLSADVLEIGVGTGVLGKEIKRIRPDLKITGIDISKNMLLEAGKLQTYTSLFQCDAENMPFKNGRFRFVFSAYMFHSALSANKCLHEIKRICRANANIIIIDLFRSNNRIPIFSKLKDNFHSVKYEHGAVSNYHTANELNKALKMIGLKVLSMQKLDTNQEYKPIGGMLHYLFEVFNQGSFIDNNRRSRYEQSIYQ